MTDWCVLLMAKFQNNRTLPKKDIMMGLRYFQTKIRYKCSGPYICVAVMEQRYSNDLRY